LKATNIEVGLLLNFGRKPEFKRFVYDNKRKNISDDQRRILASSEKYARLWNPHRGLQSEILQGKHFTGTGT
jgi:hypothetical protein